MGRNNRKVGANTTTKKAVRGGGNVTKVASRGSNSKTPDGESDFPSGSQAVRTLVLLVILFHVLALTTATLVVVRERPKNLPRLSGAVKSGTLMPLPPMMDPIYPTFRTTTMSNSDRRSPAAIFVRDRPASSRLSRWPSL